MKTTPNTDAPTQVGAFPLYFCHCSGDGSWLTELEGGIFRTSPDPDEPARITLEQAVELGIEGGAYLLTPCRLTLSQLVLMVIGNRHLQIEFLKAGLKQRYPQAHKLTMGDVANLVNVGIRRGELEIDKRGLIGKSESAGAGHWLLALSRARVALKGDSNDAEHDALYLLMLSLGETIEEGGE